MISLARQSISFVLSSKSIIHGCNSIPLSLSLSLSILFLMQKSNVMYGFGLVWLVGSTGTLQQPLQELF